MIHYLRHLAVFARVVDKGSFRAAAKELGLAPSRVSQTVSDLEDYLQVTLFYRTTRKLSLSEQGRQLYDHASFMVRSAEAGLNELNALAETPRGSLKITLPAFLESSAISAAIADFLGQYPEVSLSLTYTDQVMDMLDEGLDLRITAGQGGLQDSSMMCRKLGEIRMLPVASTAYAKKRRLPHHASDLQDWDWINFQNRSNKIRFVSPENKEVVITVNPRIDVNSANAVLFFIKQHGGIHVMPENLVDDGVASGELVHLLPDWRTKPLECYAIWPDKSLRENLTVLLVRHLVEKGL